MPTEAAGEYGDQKFVQMMFAKVGLSAFLASVQSCDRASSFLFWCKIMMKQVMCVHLVGLTGVDFLFQDVDVVWFKDPLEYFLDPNSPVYNYDAYFQVSILPNCSKMAGFRAHTASYKRRTTELVALDIPLGRRIVGFTSSATIIELNTF